MPFSTVPTPAASASAARAGTEDESSLKAVLWDMDGTLVDTEPYWIAAETTLVRAHGGHWGPEQGLALVGNALEDSAAVLQAAGVDMGIREIVDQLSGEVAAAVRRDVPWRPGARELLHDLYENGVRCALVTMSEAPLAREVVGALPLPYFEFLVTGDQVTRGKPDPEPYLTAIERLAAQDPALGPANCVALEDSLPGLASAMGSGVITVGIPHVVPLPDDGGRTTWPTLTGRSTADLRLLVAERSRL